MYHNNASVLGNLTADPYVTETPGGHTCSSFTVATNKSYKDQQGEWQSIPEFIPCVMWGKVSKTLEQAKKGDRVFVSGRINTSSWEQEGQKRYKTQVGVNQFILLRDLPKDGGGQGDPFDADYVTGEIVEKPKAKPYKRRAPTTYKAKTLEEAEANIEKRKTQQAQQPQNDVSIEDVPF